MVFVMLLTLPLIYLAYPYNVLRRCWLDSVSVHEAVFHGFSRSAHTTRVLRFDSAIQRFKNDFQWLIWWIWPPYPSSQMRTFLLDHTILQLIFKSVVGNSPSWSCCPHFSNLWSRSWTPQPRVAPPIMWRFCFTRLSRYCWTCLWFYVVSFQMSWL